MTRTVNTLAVFALVALIQACASPPPEGTSRTNIPDNNPPILVTDNGDHFGLTVSLSDVVMSLPKGSLRRSENRRGGATTSRRYFYFSGRDSVVSGWFESAGGYTDLRGRWQTEMEGLRRQGLPSPTEVEEVQVGQMKGIIYTYVRPEGTSSHIRSTYLSPGTWVDLHLSSTVNAPSTVSRAQVIALARSITFVPKAPR